MNDTEFNNLVKKIEKLDESVSSSAMESLKNIDVLLEDGTIDKFQSISNPLERKIFIQNNPEFKKFIENFKFTYYALAESLKGYYDLSNKLSGRTDFDEVKTESVK